MCFVVVEGKVSRERATEQESGPPIPAIDLSAEILCRTACRSVERNAVIGLPQAASLMYV